MKMFKNLFIMFMLMLEIKENWFILDKKLNHKL